jgi:HK97 family phage major capsid protein
MTMLLNRCRFATLFAAATFFNTLKNSQQLREEIAEHRERIAAIEQVARDEKRELSDDEAKEIDMLIGSGTPGAVNHQVGRIAMLEKQLERAEKIEANQASLASLRARTNPLQTSPEPNEGGNTTENRSRIIIPTNMLAHDPLKAFKGPDAPIQAYIAGRFYLATLFKHDESREWCEANGIDVRIHNVQSGGTDAKGGFLIPPELARTIIELRESRGIFRQEAEREQMIGDVKDCPKRLSGPTAQWQGATGAAAENTAITDSDASWGNVQLIANKMTTLIKYSSEVSEDAIISMADKLTMEIAYAFADLEDRTGFLGDGTAGFGGFTGICSAMQPGAVYTATGKVKYADLTISDFQTPLGMLAEYADENVKWYVNKKCWTLSMCKILEAMGGNTGADVATGTARVKEFLAQRVVLTSVFPKTITSITGQFYGVVGDIRQGVKLGDRRIMTIAVSDQRYFELDQLAIRGTQRAAIKVHEVGTATDAGSLVALKMG